MDLLLLWHLNWFPVCRVPCRSCQPYHTAFGIENMVFVVIVVVIPVDDSIVLRIQCYWIGVWEVVHVPPLFGRDTIAYCIHMYTRIYPNVYQIPEPTVFRWHENKSSPLSMCRRRDALLINFLCIIKRTEENSQV